MSETVEVLERVYFDRDGKPTKWVRSFDGGQSWEAMNCSAYPESRPPFLLISTEKLPIAFIETMHTEERP